MRLLTRQALLVLLMQQDRDHEPDTSWLLFGPDEAMCKSDDDRPARIDPRREHNRF